MMTRSAATVFEHTMYIYTYIMWHGQQPPQLSNNRETITEKNQDVCMLLLYYVTFKFRRRMTSQQSSSENTTEYYRHIFTSELIRQSANSHTNK